MGKSLKKLAASMTVKEFKKIYHDPERKVTDLEKEFGTWDVNGLARLMGVKTRRELGIKAKQQRRTDRLGSMGCGRCPMHDKCLKQQKDGYTGQLPCEELLPDEVGMEVESDTTIYYVSPGWGDSSYRIDS